MLMEKLESDIPTARLSAMDVFVSTHLMIFSFFLTRKCAIQIHCIDEYDARDMSSYLVPLWNLFSKQV
jgi:hypothetical protein